MTPKEKAQELFDKFSNHVIVCKDYDGGYDLYEFHKNSQKCAWLAVDEIIKQWEYVNTYLADLDGELNPNLIFWYEVKKEIEAL